MTTFRTIPQLRHAGVLVPESDAHAAELAQVAARYSVAVSQTVVDTITTADATDPVARQYIPSAQELVAMPTDRADPIGDDEHSPMAGLVHRYPDRVLIKATQVCPVYCRFCFRRESVGGNAERPLGAEQFEAIFEYIASHQEIWEVIISGGDPLVLSDARLRTLLAGLDRAKHVRVIRFHSRVPVVNPARVTPALVEILRGTSKAVYIAVHANHANEFGAAARAACARLADAGVPLVSQTVLLAGVNDSVQALGELMRTFVELRVTPYYLHQLDLAPGTEHFRVPIDRGQALLRALRGTYSGLCQPNYVIDLPGGFGKVSIGPGYLTPSSDGQAFDIEDIAGKRHRYPPRVNEVARDGAEKGQADE